MPKHKGIYLALASALVLSLIVGCGGSGETKSDVKLAKDQVFTTVLASEPPNIDPNIVEDTTSAAAAIQVHEGLLRFNQDLTVGPGLAEKWEVSADGKTYTFKLRDAKYSDGQPVKAGDFVYSWQRLANPATGSHYGFLIDQVKGAAAVMAAMVPTDSAKLPDLIKAMGVSAPDDKTFKVELADAASYFPSIAAMINTVPLRKDLVEKGGKTWMTDPTTYIGAGPFKMLEYKSQAQIVMIPNPNYYGTKPTLTKVVMKIITEDKAQFEAFKNNEVDVVKTPLAEIANVKKDPELSKLVLTGATLGTYYFGFNITKPPFKDNLALRQAISMAVDRETFVQVVKSGVDLPATSFVPPGLFGHQPDIGYKFDVTKAKAKLAEAGYADPTKLGEITYYYNTSAGHKTIAEFIQAQLQTNLGIKVKLENQEWGAYLSFLKKKDYSGMFRMGWNADYPHPQNFLDVVFNSKSGTNYSGFNNAEFDKLLAQANTEPDQKKQTELYNKAQKILVDEAPVVFLYFYGRFTLVKPWVKNLTTTTMDPYIGDYFLNKIQIAEH